MAAANSQPSAGGGTASTGSPGSQPNSPPQYQMDQMSITDAMDANRLALNKRLQLRRSMNELVDAGIYPTSPHAFAGQRILLERAKAGDILKHKIEQRPGREFLVQHHILEDSNVDPSLQSARRQLKKARLTDELNEKLAHRPGPLELVEQRILEADDPIKVAIKEGKLEFQKTEEVTEPAAIPECPYEVESPKSGQSSPEPSDCDTESGTTTAISSGFNPPAVPSPPDITPLLGSIGTHTSITIGGKTLKIPITAQSFVTPGQLVAVAAPHHFTTGPQSHRQQPSNFGANRNNRRTAKQNRPKQQVKQRVIKFHEYKGPSASKSSNPNSSSAGTFVTTTGPLQSVDGLTPYQVRVQQQQLYLQCQLEVQHNDTAPPTVLVPIHTPASNPMMSQQHQLVQQPMTPQQQQVEMPEPLTPRQVEPVRSRPVTPCLSLKSPSLPQIIPGHNPLHTSRSLSHLEDMKVADLKQELKQRNLTVSGSKPQLVERLRAHQLKEMSASVPSVSNANTSADSSGSSNLTGVKSFSDDMLMAPPSVASVGSSSVGTYLSSPPLTPCSPQEEFMRSPLSVMSANHCMDTEDNSQASKSTAEIVREQAKQIEELQRKLMQFQQQFQIVQQPQQFVVPSTPASQNVEQTSSQPQSPRRAQREQLTPQQMHELLQKQQQLVQPQLFSQQAQQQGSPVDITDKQVYLATADGKMTAYKVIMHTGNGIMQQMTPQTETSELQRQDSTLSTATMADAEVIPQSQLLPNDGVVGTDHTQSTEKVSLMPNGEGVSTAHGINVDDVLEILIRTGEIDPQTMSSNQQPNSNQEPYTSTAVSDPPPTCFSSSFLTTSPPLQINGNMSAPTSDLELHEPLSPLVDMDWMDAEPSNNYLDDLDGPSTPSLVESANDNGFMYNGSGLDWLSDVMHFDTSSAKNSHPYNNIHSTSGELSTSDPLLSPKPPDMNIFELDEPDFRISTESGSDINWDKLIGQPSHHL